MNNILSSTFKSGVRCRRARGRPLTQRTTLALHDLATLYILAGSGTLDAAEHVPPC